MKVLLLLDLANAVERKLDRALSCTRGISFREYRILKMLSTVPAGGAMRVELAEATGLTPSAITRALKPLEKLGYLRTEPGGRDARRSLAKLSPGGAVLLADVKDTVADILNEMPLTELSLAQLTAMQTSLLGRTTANTARWRAE